MTRLLLEIPAVTRLHFDACGFIVYVYCGDFISVSFSDLRRPDDGASDVRLPRTRLTTRGDVFTVVAPFPGSAV